MNEQLLETWEIHNRINLYLLDALKEEHLKDGLTSKGRNTGEQFAHIHNVRLIWLKASWPEGLEGLEKIVDKKVAFGIGSGVPVNLCVAGVV